MSDLPSPSKSTRMARIVPADDDPTMAAAHAVTTAAAIVRRRTVVERGAAPHMVMSIVLLGVDHDRWNG
jgi:hypothetical protein